MHQPIYPSQSFPVMNPGNMNRPFPFSAPIGNPNNLPGPQVFYSNKRLQNINCILQPTENQGGLFLGDVLCLIKKQILIENNIHAILTCMTSKDAQGSNLDLNNLNVPSSIVNKKVISARDALDYPIDVHFQESYDYIQTMRAEKKNVFVHCHAGVSRSAAIVCAYLMKKNGWGFDQAFSFLKSRRQRVRPNQNFLQLLRKYESSVRQDKIGNQTPKQSFKAKQSFINHEQSFIEPQIMNQSKDNQSKQVISHTFIKPQKINESKAQNNQNKQVISQANIAFLPQKQSEIYFSPQKNSSRVYNQRQTSIKDSSQDATPFSKSNNHNSKNIDRSSHLKFSKNQNKKQDHRDQHFFNNDGSVTIFSASRSYGLGESDLNNKNNKSSLLSTGEKQPRRIDQSKIMAYQEPKSQNRIPRNKIFTPSKPSTPQLTQLPQKNSNPSFLTVSSKPYSYGSFEKDNDKNEPQNKKNSMKSHNNANCFLEGIKKLCS